MGGHRGADDHLSEPIAVDVVDDGDRRSGEASVRRPQQRPGRVGEITHSNTPSKKGDGTVTAPITGATFATSKLSGACCQAECGAPSVPRSSQVTTSPFAAPSSARVIVATPSTPTMTAFGEPSTSHRASSETAAPPGSSSGNVPVQVNRASLRVTSSGGCSGPVDSDRTTSVGWGGGKSPTTSVASAGGPEASPSLGVSVQLRRAGAGTDDTGRVQLSEGNGVPSSVAKAQVDPASTAPAGPRTRRRRRSARPRTRRGRPGDTSARAGRSRGHHRSELRCTPRRRGSSRTRTCRRACSCRRHKALR